MTCYGSDWCAVAAEAAPSAVVPVPPSRDIWRRALAVVADWAAKRKREDPSFMTTFYDSNRNHLFTRDSKGRMIDSAVDHASRALTEEGAVQPAARRMLVGVQAAPTERLRTLADVQAYLGSAGLRVGDVPGDGNCWLHCIGMHLPQPDNAKPLTHKGVVRVQNCRLAMSQFLDNQPDLFDFSLSVQRFVDGSVRTLREILLRKQQYDEPEFWHIIANMTGRVIQLYISWPLEDTVGWCGLAYDEDYFVAPFAMVFVCPHESVQLTSREPIRVWKLLQWSGDLHVAACPEDCAECGWSYPGHYMRILPLGSASS